MISSSVERFATAATRSVPLGQSAGVMTASPPNPRTASAILALSVATTTRLTRRACDAASHTHWTSAFPAMIASGFSGKRCAANRDGITASTPPLDTTVLDRLPKFVGDDARGAELADDDAGGKIGKFRGHARRRAPGQSQRVRP